MLIDDDTGWRQTRSQDRHSQRRFRYSACRCIMVSGVGRAWVTLQLWEGSHCLKFLTVIARDFQILAISGRHLCWHSSVWPWLRKQANHLLVSSLFFPSASPFHYPMAWTWECWCRCCVRFPYVFFKYGKRLRGTSRFASTWNRLVVLSVGEKSTLQVAASADSHGAGHFAMICCIALCLLLVFI